MGNTIVYPSEYTQALDLAYKAENLTSFLDNTQSRWLGKTFQIKRVTVQGPATMTRGSEYPGGEATVAWQTVTPDYDRGRKFTVDALDEAECVGLLTDALFEYERVWSIPEIDAYRIAKYASKAGRKATEATLSDAAALVAALIVGQADLDGKAPAQGRVLFIEASMWRAVEGLATTVSKDVFKGFSKIVPVPQDEFYTAINLLSGSTGEEAGGYTRYGHGYAVFAGSHAYSLGDLIEADGKIYEVTTAGTSGSTAPTWPTTGTVANGAGALVFTFVAKSGHAINFIILHPQALEQAIRRSVSPIMPPDADIDSYRGSNRKYGYCDVKTNKLNWIYLHAKASA
jgi:hypothetical protein